MAGFLRSFDGEREWAEVRIRRVADGFELRHRADRDAAALDDLPLSEARTLALSDAEGRFRPLKSAPDLRRGWRLFCRGPRELWRALQDLYPGSIPDGYAARQAAPPVTSYRDFTNRQTGMYRVTQQLSGEQAALVIRACCPPRLCLKRRLWSAERVAPDAPQAKSEIPCLEPCALLLELARKSARIGQQEKRAIGLAPDEWETLFAAARTLIEHPPGDARTGDIAAPLNPRRLQLVLEKYAAPGEARPPDPS